MNYGQEGFIHIFIFQNRIFPPSHIDSVKPGLHIQSICLVVFSPFFSFLKLTLRAVVYMDNILHRFYNLEADSAALAPVFDQSTYTYVWTKHHSLTSLMVRLGQGEHLPWSRSWKGFSKWRSKFLQSESTFRFLLCKPEVNMMRKMFLRWREKERGTRELTVLRLWVSFLGWVFMITTVISKSKGETWGQTVFRIPCTV